MNPLNEQVLANPVVILIEPVRSKCILARISFAPDRLIEANVSAAAGPIGRNNFAIVAQWGSCC